MSANTRKTPPRRSQTKKQHRRKGLSPTAKLNSQEDRTVMMGWTVEKHERVLTDDRETGDLEHLVWVRSESQLRAQFDHRAQAHQ